MIAAFGSSSLRLAYALALSDLILAPATPSNTARVGGVIMPITTSLAKASVLNLKMDLVKLVPS